MAEKLPPLCRYCGGPIRKKAKTVYIIGPGSGMTGAQFAGVSYVRLDEYPKTKAECVPLTNETILSVSRSHGGGYIDHFTTWDGESYDDPFFCKGDHARRFGYVVARGGKATIDYISALAAQAKAATAKERA